MNASKLGITYPCMRMHAHHASAQLASTSIRDASSNLRIEAGLNNKKRLLEQWLH